MLDPQAGRHASVPAVVEKFPRRARQVKQYKNSHNGEIIETKSGNHKLLKEQKTEYGSDEVEGWLAREARLQGQNKPSTGGSGLYRWCTHSLAIRMPFGAGRLPAR